MALPRASRSTRRRGAALRARRLYRTDNVRTCGIPNLVPPGQSVHLHAGAFGFGTITDWGTPLHIGASTRASPRPFALHRVAPPRGTHSATAAPTVPQCVLPPLRAHPTTSHDRCVRANGVTRFLPACRVPASRARTTAPPHRSLRAMDLKLAPPHDAWDTLTQSWVTDLPLAALARAQAVHIAKAKLSTSPLSKPSPPWVPPPVVTPQMPAAEAASLAAASGSEEVPMTPEAAEASSLALAWRLQQEEQAAFYHAINENTPGPTARSVAATPGEAPLMAALGEAESPEDASLQLALRLQQAREPSYL